VNNAALERLSSITERVQARPAAAALEKAPAKKKPIAGNRRRLLKP
jgi:DNA polymerase-3 subunit gamma/tau